MLLANCEGWSIQAALRIIAGDEILLRRHLQWRTQIWTVRDHTDGILSALAVTALLKLMARRVFYSANIKIKVNDKGVVSLTKKMQR